MKLFVCLFLTCASLFAAPLTKVMLINAGDPPMTDGKDYVGPYTLQLPGGDVPALCIDLADEAQVGEQWTAFVSPLEGSLADTYHPEQRVAYEEEAYLYSLITEPGGDRTDLQHAAWSLTDSAYGPDASAERWISQAQRDYETIDFKKFVVVSEAPGDTGSRSQEFIAVSPVAEPAWINLMAGLTAIGLALIGRKRGCF